MFLYEIHIWFGNVHLVYIYIYICVHADTRQWYEIQLYQYCRNGVFLLHALETRAICQEYYVSTITRSSYIRETYIDHFLEKNPVLYEHFTCCYMWYAVHAFSKHPFLFKSPANYSELYKWESTSNSYIHVITDRGSYYLMYIPMCNVREILNSLLLVNSPHKWPVTRKMFPFDDAIITRIQQTLDTCCW